MRARCRQSWVIASAVIGLSIVAPAAAQQTPLSGFDGYIARAMSDWHVPGLAIAIVKDSQVVFVKGFGVREAGRPEPVDAHTRFAIGSTTKAMTAALIGMLVDEKKISWDDAVVKHLPWFQLSDPNVTRELTVRDLLTHRGGLGNADLLWYGQANSAAEILRRVRLVPAAYSLRSQFIYQNIMYAAAGAVAEAASGQPWAELIRTRIFEPLDMRETLPTLPSGTQANIASPHYFLEGRVRVVQNASVDPIAPAGSVWSSVSDMAKWMQFVLDGGRVGGAAGRRLLSEETVAELFKPQTIAPAAMYPTTSVIKPHWMTYGLGWFQQDYRGRAVDFHTGSIDGMVAIHGLIRDERLGVYVVANLDHAELRHALMYSVFDRFGAGSTRDWSAEFLQLYGDLRKKAGEEKTREAAARVSGTSPSLPLEKYVGRYDDPLYGQIEVTTRGGALVIRFGAAPLGTAKLEHWHYNTFRTNWEAEWRSPELLTFVIGADGTSSAVELFGARFVRRQDRSASQDGNR